jgi:hypothetical protein
MADLKQAQRWDGKAIGTAGVDVEVYELHPAYKIRPTPEKKGETGYLRMIEVFPTQSSLYGFICRWDENPEVLDVDMAEPVGDSLQRIDWQHGYSGHHPKRSPEDGRKFKVHITMADASGDQSTVFHGVVKFGIVHGVRITDFIGAADLPSDATVSRGETQAGCAPGFGEHQIRETPYS